MPKKTSGLSKKVPAIFQDLPDIDHGTSRPEPLSSQAPRPVWAEGFRLISSLGRFLPQTHRTRFLFEVGGASAKVLIFEHQGPSDWKYIGSERFRYASAPAGGSSGGTESLGKWLKDLVSRYGVPGSFEVRLLLRGKGVYLTVIPKPEAPAKTIKDAVIWEIAEKLSFPVEESKILYEERGDRFLVAALHNPFFQEILTPFHEAQVYPSLVTVLPVAYEALHRRYRLLSSRNILLIHLGGKKTYLMVYREGRIFSWREIEIGGEGITSAMMGTLVVEDKQVVINYEDAETLKKAIGLPTPDLMPNPEEPKLSQLAARIRPIFEKLVLEVRGTLLQFQRQFPSDRIEEIQLAGGGAQLKSLDAYLSSQLHMPVQKLDSEKIEGATDLSDAALAGLQYVEGRCLNFALPEDSLRPRCEKLRDYLKFGSLPLAIVLAVLWGVTGIRTWFTRMELAREERRLYALGPVAEKIREIEKINRQIKEEKQLLERGIPQGALFGSVMREISQVVPPQVVFQEMKYERKGNQDAFPKMRISGEIDPSASAPDLVLSRFLEELNRSPFFASAKLVSRTGSGYKTGGETGLQFVVETTLVLPDEI